MKKPNRDLSNFDNPKNIHNIINEYWNQRNFSKLKTYFIQWYYTKDRIIFIFAL